jgi:hypothetical protein
VNSPTINLGVQVSLLCADLHSLGYMSKSGIGIVGPCGNSTFSFLRHLPYLFS